MAEILGIAASIIQVAGAGTKLATSLYNFTSSALKADQEIRDIACDVELASNALESVGNIFETEDTKSIVSTKAIQDASSIILRCKEVFDGISQIVNKRRTLQKDGKSSLSLMGKLSWPVKEQRVELYRRRLESLKNSLILLLHVLQLAQGQLRGKMEQSVMEEERQKIRELHQRQQDSMLSLQSLEARLGNVGLYDDTTTLRGSSTTSRVPSLDFKVEPHLIDFPPLGKKISEHSASSSAFTIDLSTVEDSDTSNSDADPYDEDDGEVSSAELERCAKHVQKLLKSIMTLQNEMKHQPYVTREDTRWIRKKYSHFKRKFEADMAFQSVRISAPPPPPPHILAQWGRISPATKGCKPRIKQDSPPSHFAASQDIPFEFIDTDPNLDLGLNFSDDAGALENFDFDSFLHVGAENDGFGMGGDFDFGDTASAEHTTQAQYEVPEQFMPTRRRQATPPADTCPRYGALPAPKSQDPSASPRMLAVQPKGNKSPPPVLRHISAGHPAPSRSFAYELYPATKVSGESSQHCDNGSTYSTGHYMPIFREAEPTIVSNLTSKTSSVNDGPTGPKDEQLGDTSRQSFGGKLYSSFQHQEQTIIRSSEAGFMEHRQLPPINTREKHIPTLSLVEPDVEVANMPVPHPITQGYKRRRSISADREQPSPSEDPFVSKAMKRKNVKGLALGSLPSNSNQDETPRKARRIDKDIVDVLLGEWTVLEA